MLNTENIVIKGARVNNLKNIDVNIPRGQFIVITGISGSGKSSLAFDTLFAEGQRRFAESLSSYARQFLGRMSKPNVKSIEGIPPAIAIEQKVLVRNPRSTVATTTEIYDYLRIIFARIGKTYSPISGSLVKCDTEKDVLDYIFTPPKASSIYLLANINWQTREDKVEVLLSLKEEGYSRLFDVDNRQIIGIDDIIQNIDAYTQNLYLLVDRLKLPYDFTPSSGLQYNKVNPKDAQGNLIPIEQWEDLITRLYSSVSTCYAKGEGEMFVLKDNTLQGFCNKFCADGITFLQPNEYMFSFNSPLGACPVCGGLGKIIGISEDLVIPDKSLSIYDGAIAPWRGDKMGNLKDKLISLSEKYNIPIFTPYCELPQRVKDLIWDGYNTGKEEDSIVGINEFFAWVESKKYKVQFRYLLSRFSGKTTCNSCKGSRLRKDALYVKVAGKTIQDILTMNIQEAIDFFKNINLSATDFAIAKKSIEEILFRLQCVQDVGLGYLTLNRTCNTLSGGEMQRVNLVTALGSSLVGSMYILDEPSIGLHPKDTERLIGVIKKLKDIGNTVIVVEHDEQIMRAADLLIDIGPKSGIFGGEVVFQGNLNKNISAHQIDTSLTLQYLYSKKEAYKRKKLPWTYAIKIEGAMEHNLKNIDVSFPLGVLTVICGVSGSGKSSLVGDILYPALFRHINETGPTPGTFKKLSGNLDRIAAVEYVDQNPIGKNSRSNAVTYLKIYDDIRKLFAKQQYAKLNGYTPSYFSFNQEGGRCSECQGEGVVKISMQFMSDVTMVCEECGGKRFKPDILAVKYRDKTIADILDMSVGQAIDFFSQVKEEETAKIVNKLQYLADVGLSYIKLGQSSSTLSGGESQRIKLAYFLSISEGVNNNKKIMFIFDEPTTGLHFYDVEKLLKAFDALLLKGHSIIVVEHNLDVIRAADYLIELGPKAGKDGGCVVFTGSPHELIKQKGTETSQYI